MVFNFEIVLSVVSIIAAISAVLLTGRQTQLARRSLQAQAYLELEPLEITTGYREGLRSLSVLSNVSSYPEYLAKTDVDTQQKIHNTVSYLNFMAHLVDQGFMPLENVWHMYFLTYRRCFKEIPEWWLVGKRQQLQNPKLFRTYEVLAEFISHIPPSKEDIWREKLEKRLERKIHNFHV